MREINRGTAGGNISDLLQKALRALIGTGHGAGQQHHSYDYLFHGHHSNPTRPGFKPSVPVARAAGLAYMTPMTLRPILIHPDPRLKKVCDAVPDLSDELRTLANDMLETMYDAPGIGLAAPQIGMTRRLIVMDCVKEEGEAPQPMIMFNPEIILKSDDLNVYEEGCLSIPDQYAEVTRPAEVRVRWLDMNGNEQERDFDGLWATCVQHEIDHLNGVLFIDYLKPLKRQMITRKMQKLKRERARA